MDNKIKIKIDELKKRLEPLEKEYKSIGKQIDELYYQRGELLNDWVFDYMDELDSDYDDQWKQYRWIEDHFFSGGAVGLKMLEEAEFEIPDNWTFESYKTIAEYYEEHVEELIASYIYNCEEVVDIEKNGNGIDVYAEVGGHKYYGKLVIENGKVIAKERH